MTNGSTRSTQGNSTLSLLSNELSERLPFKVPRSQGIALYITSHELYVVAASSLGSKLYKQTHSETKQRSIGS